VIPIAHNSGGPRADIVVDEEGDSGPQRTGYLAESREEYAAAITTVCLAAAAGRSQVQHVLRKPLHLNSYSFGYHAAVCYKLLLDVILFLCACVGAPVRVLLDGALQVLEMEQRDRLKIAAAAQRRAATMFSTERFHQSFLASIAPLLPKHSR